MKTAKRIFSALIAFSMVFVLSGVSFAAEKVFIKEYTYQASEIDSKVTSRAQALEQAKRLVLEELGTYLMSKTEVKDFAITSDKITVLTGGVVQTEIFDEKWDGEKYYLKARIKADPDEVAKAVDRLRRDEGKTKELEKSKKRADEAFREIERLKAELATMKNDRAKQLEYAEKVNLLSTEDWFTKGMAFVNSRDFDSAIEAFSKAIFLDPNFAMAYNNRGTAYGDKGQYDRAIDDYNEAISLDPDLALAYIGRGNAYNYKGQFDRAIEDYNRAISFDPNYAPAYNNRGIAYDKKGQPDRAIEDYNKAISLDPNLAYAYSARGGAYGMKGQLDRAIEDFSKAISLDPNLAGAYSGRGFAYNKKGQPDRAIEDYSRAISLSPKDAVLYAVRGNAYLDNGQPDRAIEDFNRAISLDLNFALAYNNRGYAYLKKGQNNRAIADYKRSCELGDNDGCELLKVMEGER